MRLDTGYASLSSLGLIVTSCNNWGWPAVELDFADAKIVQRGFIGGFKVTCPFICFPVHSCAFEPTPVIKRLQEKVRER